MQADVLDDMATAQYLTFELSGEVYGVDILKVQEIKGWEPVREMPNTPNYIRGMLDLRGVMVPIVDLRARFGLDDVEYTAVTVVIVLSIAGAQSTQVMGIVADAVSDVLDVKPGKIQPNPDLGPIVDTRYMKGMVLGKPTVMLLDVDKLLDPSDFSTVEVRN